MKQALLSVSLFTALIASVAFAPILSIESVISAIRAGNAAEVAKFMDDNLDISMPDKTASYSKAQAVMVLKDFFARNSISGFDVKHKGEKSGNQFCIGMLQTKAGTYRTTVFMKTQASRQVIKEIKFEPI